MTLINLHPRSSWPSIAKRIQAGRLTALTVYIWRGPRVYSTVRVLTSTTGRAWGRVRPVMHREGDGAQPPDWRPLEGSR